MAIVALLVGAVALCGVPAAAQSTERVSVATGGAQASGESWWPAISGDGRYVVFESYASDVVAGDVNGLSDIFVHDRDTGQTTRLSVAMGTSETNGESHYPAISADGRYVSFMSSASNLVPGDTNGVLDIFVHDRSTGATTRVTVDSAGAEANNVSYGSALSSDGRYVVFESDATNLVAGDTNNARDIFLHDRQTGQTTRVSVDDSGAEANGHSQQPAISDDGRYVGFYSDASNLVADDTNTVADVFVHDRISGETTLVSVSTSGVQANWHCWYPSLSADGRLVAFFSQATNLVFGDANGAGDVFVHDRFAGTTSLVSIDSAGAQGNNVSLYPAISADGRYVAFLSWASNLVPDDENGEDDVFVHDRLLHQTTQVSVPTGGPRPTWPIYMHPSISADGRHIAFASQASTLVPDDTNGVADVFVHDREPEPGEPDLVVDSLNVTPNPATAGQTITIATTVRNRGGAAVATYLQVWRHRTTPVNPWAIGNYTHPVAALGTGDTEAFSDSFTPTYPGERTALAFVDAGDLNEESNEDNNAASTPYTIQPTNADLTFETFTVAPDPVSLGNQATISATVVNQGSDPAPSCRVQLWRHRTAQPVLGTTGDYTHTTDALAAGATQTFASQFWPHYQGSRTAWGVVDSLNVVAENDETNNKTSYAYAIQPGMTPDLVAEVTITPDSVTLGSSGTLTARVENTAPVAAGAFTLAAWRHRTAPPIVGSPPDVTWAIVDLLPGAVETRATTFSPGYAGARTAWCLADSANTVVENNEGNNVAYQEYAIVTGDEPDLVASVSVAPDPVALGTIATIAAQVRNEGASAAGPFVLAAWQHRPDPPGPSSSPDYTWPLAGLRPSASATFTEVFTPGFAGTRAAWVFADSAEAILELSEANNIASDAYTISAAGGSGALTVTAASASATRGGQAAISYTLSARADVELQIRNVAGRPVARVQAGDQEAGPNAATWNGLGATGARVPAGVYLCEIVARNAEGQSARAATAVRMVR